MTLTKETLEKWADDAEWVAGYIYGCDDHTKAQNLMSIGGYLRAQAAACEQGQAAPAILTPLCLDAGELDIGKAPAAESGEDAKWLRRLAGGMDEYARHPITGFWSECWTSEANQTRTIADTLDALRADIERLRAENALLKHEPETRP